MIVQSAKQINVLNLFVHDVGLEASGPFNDGELCEALNKILEGIFPMPERVTIFTPDDTGLDRWTLKYWPDQYQEDKFKRVSERKDSIPQVRAAMPKKVLEYLEALDKKEVTLP